jgi:hypothetical protein
MRTVIVAAAVVAAVGLGALPAVASNGFEPEAWPRCASEPARANLWTVNWAVPAPARPAVPVVDFATVSATTETGAQAARRPVAFEYSDGYKTRARIHKVASIATLPLFVAEYLVGANLYNHPGTASDSARSVHGVLAASTGVLFGINSITGVWNMVEARKDPRRSSKRTIHGILMLVADAGFAVTAATAPESEHGQIEHDGDGGSRSTHRAIAVTSMGIAAVSYLMMLFGGN